VQRHRHAGFDDLDHHALDSVMTVATAPVAPPEAARQAGDEILFQPIKLGRYNLRHRIVMAPLTRSRARQPGNVPTALNACYYAQRASAALIISEATQVSMQGQGYAWTPGIHSREQIEGWRLVTQAVHDAGGLIFLQLWHVGRISHPLLQPDNMLPVAPSAIKPSGEAFVTTKMASRHWCRSRLRAHCRSKRCPIWCASTREAPATR